MTANRPASARLLAVATAGRLAATYTTSGDTTAGIDDYKGAPVLLLRSLAPLIETLALRARAFDTIWSSDRRYSDAAIAAVETYCAIAHGIMDGRLTELIKSGPNSVP